MRRYTKVGKGTPGKSTYKSEKRKCNRDEEKRAQIHSFVWTGYLVVRGSGSGEGWEGEVGTISRVKLTPEPGAVATAEGVL